MTNNIGKIDSLGKYDLETNKWKNVSSSYELGRSNAIASYDQIVNNEQDGINYIIIAYGNRVEDCSKDFETIKLTKMSINKVIEYFEKKNQNYNIKLFFMDADAPISEDAKVLANYIDLLATNKTTKSINLIGLSKCGAMSFNIPKHFKTADSFKKTNIYTIATPFEGTRLASPRLVYSDIKDILTSLVGDNILRDKMYKDLIKFYESISSNSHMDYDIAIKDGIPLDKQKFYDKTFIENTFSKENLESISKIRSYHNITTGVDDKTLIEAIRTGNMIGIGLCIVDNLIFNKTSDGMVPVLTQRKVESYLDEKKITTHKLVSSHHDVLSNKRLVNDLLYVVNDTIEEQSKVKTKR